MATTTERDGSNEAAFDPEAVGVTPPTVKLTEKQRREIGQCDKWKRKPRDIFMFCAGIEVDWSEEEWDH